ncbi:uncharacterized protein LOC124918801 [Impatiens glandulifera]|uniref:uncharacterized protein LOC124918801 n=1 Tax=Impatiens glandulifera TaxID=253017 RepID=UPI001FB17D1D|nr:uncharacterized protein LOC124918801 [Impatiens glandulifera]
MHRSSLLRGEQKMEFLRALDRNPNRYPSMFKHLPNDVMKAHNIKLPSRVMMTDVEGITIYAKVLISWTDGRKRIIDGWKKFVRYNNLNEDDRCICEFLVNNNVEDSDESEVFLKMTVIRAGSWLA